jgi:ABC-type sugar transport system permease subunit
VDRAGATRPVARRRPWWRRQQVIAPYIFIAPFFVIFFVFFLGPAVFAFYVGFHQWQLLGPMQYVGLKNYRALLLDSTFWQSVTNTLYYVASGVLVQWPLALVLAVILSQRVLPGKRVLTPVYFIPILTSSVVVAIVFVLLLDQKYGLFNAPLVALGLGPVNWLGSAQLSKFAVIVLLAWRWTGYNMILFLAAIQAIPRELYEAAWVDGAGKLQTFLRITVPLLRPAVAYVMILGIIGGWQIFDEPWILTTGGPADSSLSVGNFLFRMSIQNLRMGYGSALGTVLFIFVFVISVVQMRFFGIYSGES